MLRCRKVCACLGFIDYPVEMASNVCVFALSEHKILHIICLICKYCALPPISGVPCGKPMLQTG